LEAVTKYCVARALNGTLSECHAKMIGDVVGATAYTAFAVTMFTLFQCSLAMILVTAIVLVIIKCLPPLSDLRFWNDLPTSCPPPGSRGKKEGEVVPVCKRLDERVAPVETSEPTSKPKGVERVYALEGTDEFEAKLGKCGAKSLIRITSDRESVFHALGVEDFLRGKAGSQEERGMTQEDCRTHTKAFAMHVHDNASTALEKLVRKMTPTQFISALKKIGEQTGAKMDIPEEEGVELENNEETFVSDGKVVMSCEALVGQLLEVADELNSNSKSTLTRLNDEHMVTYRHQFRLYTKKDHIDELCEVYKAFVAQKKFEEAEEVSLDFENTCRNTVRDLWNSSNPTTNFALVNLRKKVEEIVLEKRGQAMENVLLLEQALPVPNNLCPLSQVFWHEERYDFLRETLTSMLDSRRMSPEEFFSTLDQLLKMETEATAKIMDKTTDFSAGATIEKVIANLCQRHREYVKKVVRDLKMPAFQRILKSWTRGEDEWKYDLESYIMLRHKAKPVHPNLDLLVLSQIIDRTVCCLTRLRGDENGARYVWHQYTKNGQIASIDVDQKWEQHIREHGEGFLCQYEGAAHFDYAAVAEASEVCVDYVEVGASEEVCALPDDGEITVR